MRGGTRGGEPTPGGEGTLSAGRTRGERAWVPSPGSRTSQGWVGDSPDARRVRTPSTAVSLELRPALVPGPGPDPRAVSFPVAGGAGRADPRPRVPEEQETEEKKVCTENPGSAGPPRPPFPAPRPVTGRRLWGREGKEAAGAVWVRAEARSGGAVWVRAGGAEAGPSARVSARLPAAGVPAAPAARASRGRRGARRARPPPPLAARGASARPEEGGRRRRQPRRRRPRRPRWEVPYKDAARPGPTDLSPRFAASARGGRGRTPDRPGLRRTPALDSRQTDPGSLRPRTDPGSRRTPAGSRLRADHRQTLAGSRLPAPDRPRTDPDPGETPFPGRPQAHGGGPIPAPESSDAPRPWTDPSAIPAPGRPQADPGPAGGRAGAEGAPGGGGMRGPRHGVGGV